MEIEINGSVIERGSELLREKNKKMKEMISGIRRKMDEKALEKGGCLSPPGFLGILENPNSQNPEPCKRKTEEQLVDKYCKKRKKEDSHAEEHKHPISYVITVHSKMDPSKDTFKYMFDKLLKWMSHLEEYSKKFGLKMICGQIEWKDKTNSRNDDPISIRPNYHLHICIVFFEETPYDTVKHKIQEFIKKKFHRLTYNDKRYPWREWAYVQKEKYRHEPIVIYFTESEEEGVEFEKSILKKWDEYPDSKRRLESEEHQTIRLHDERTLGYWNAIVTLRNFFTYRRIRWIFHKDELKFVCKGIKNKCCLVEEFISYIKSDPYMKYHFSVRGRQYIKLICNEIEFKNYMEEFELEIKR